MKILVAERAFTFRTVVRPVVAHPFILSASTGPSADTLWATGRDKDLLDLRLLSESQIDDEELLDRLKVLEYLLYHDVVEVYAGDAKFNNPDELRMKHYKEADSMRT